MPKFRVQTEVRFRRDGAWVLSRVGAVVVDAADTTRAIQAARPAAVNAARKAHPELADCTADPAATYPVEMIVIRAGAA